MKKLLPHLALVPALLLLVSCEQGFKDDSKVLVKVNGTEITEAAYQNYRNILQNQQQRPVEDNEQNRTVLLEQMVFNKLMTQEAKNQKLNLNPEVHYTIEVQRDEVLIGAVARNYLKTNPVTDAEVKERYAQLSQTKEYLVSHILVDNQKLAEEIIDQLKKKASFKTLAAKYSTHEQSKHNGGRIDWINPQFIVPAIYDAANEQKKTGLIMQPVQSRYGWHVVKVDGVRNTKLAPLDQIKPAIVEQLQREKISELGRYLRKGATIEYVGKKKS